MAKKLEAVTILGELQGNILWPNAPMTKAVREVFTPDNSPFSRQWSGLRDALLQITNDGDFQSCRLANGWMIVSWIDGNKRIEISADVPFCKLTDDCLAVM